MFVWDYNGVPKDGAFEIELAQAPRFDLLKYVKWRKCANRGVRIEHRLDEYWGLYQEKPDESWWGWNYLKTTNKWLPKPHKGANLWSVGCRQASGFDKQSRVPTEPRKVGSLRSQAELVGGPSPVWLAGHSLPAGAAPTTQMVPAEPGIS